MLQKLALNEFLELSKNARHIAVFQEILADRLTPINVYETLANDLSSGAILESGLQQQQNGRFSFLAFDSFAQLIAKDGVITQLIGSESTQQKITPFHALRELTNKLQLASRKDVAEYTTSAIGFITYDAIRYFEAIPDQHAADPALPDILFNFYRTTLTFDHQQQKLLISMVTDVSDNPTQDYQQTMKKIEQLITTISHLNSSPTTTPHQPLASVVNDVEDDAFIELIQKAKEYIRRGDAFQIVLSRCFQQAYTTAPFAIYRALRKVSPSPYMFYLPQRDRVIIGASPERLVSVRGKQICVNPIAGTRKRNAETNDEAIAADILQDKKEIAEHMMLVDLARNDVGAVSTPGSVKISEFLQVKHYSHVSHLTSVITGQLRDACDAFDALAAAFPAGTLSGAPKIRAMEIIDELEASRRGLYGGAICRLDYNGDFESCIAIRMAVLKDGLATIRTGAGIVHDSNPTSEAQETRLKAASMLAAIKLAEEGLL